MLAYRLQDRPPGTVLMLSALQWFFFTAANVITVPIVLAHSFSLNPLDTALYINRTFFVCGLIGVLQAVFGHRYAIIEGPAGMWWGVFLILIQMTRELGGTMSGLLQELEFGLLCGALVYILLAVFRVMEKIRFLFTPVVTGTFLILLSLQVSKSLIEGILGIGYQGNTHVQPVIALISICLIGFTIGLMMYGKGLIKSLAVLVGIVIGWGVYGLLGKVQLEQTPLPFLAMPHLFPFGTPRFHSGIVITCVITSVILLSNLIASIQSFATVAEEVPSSREFTRGTLISGIGTALAGCFGIVGAVPLTAAASLVSLTGIAARLPFLLASAAVVLLGLFPRIGQLMVTLPAPVGYAVLFTVFGQLLGFGLRDIKQLALDQRDLFVVSLPLLTGVGTLFVPGEAWLGLTPVLGYILGNGLIVGILIVLLLEHVVFKRKKAPAAYFSGS